MFLEHVCFSTAFIQYEVEFSNTCRRRLGQHSVNVDGNAGNANAENGFQRRWKRNLAYERNLSVRCK